MARRCVLLVRRNFALNPHVLQFGRALDLRLDDAADFGDSILLGHGSEQQLQIDAARQFATQGHAFYSHHSMPAERLCALAG